MAHDNLTKPSASVWTRILTDVHFWVPVIVLLAGLVVLHWMQ